MRDTAGMCVVDAPTVCTWKYLVTRSATLQVLRFGVDGVHSAIVATLYSHGLVHVQTINHPTPLLQLCPTLSPS